MPSFITRTLPLPVVILLAALAAIAIVNLYRRDRKSVSPVSGRVLMGLRLATGLMLVLLAADPACVARRSVEERSRLWVVVDVSASSRLREPSRPAAQVEAEASALGGPVAEVRDASRRELAALAISGRWMEDLRRRFDVSLLALSAELVPFADAPPAAGGGTDLLQPIADEIVRARDGALAGVILFSDGHHHRPGGEREGLERLRRLATPIVCVALGATERGADVSVDAVDATGVVFAGDEVKALVTIGAVGVEGAATIEVVDGETPIASVPIRLAAGASSTAWPVSFPSGAAGRKKLTVRVPRLEAEEVDGNNTRDLWLDVLSTKARVLLLDGVPRWEQRFLRAAWSREESVELSSFLATPPPERRLPTEFPRGREALFELDVIVLGDVEPGLFAQDELALLQDFVRARGGAVVFIAGERAMPYRWSETPLADLLPVNLVEPPPLPGAGRIAEDARLRLTALGETAAITRLVPGREANVELWGLLAGPRWACPVAGVKPGAEVLATVNEHPVLLTRVFGGGRVLFAGTDSTWKWRYKFGDELHRRFWGQVLRWAMSRQLSAADDKVQLGTDSAFYVPAARVRIDALLRGRAEGEPDTPVDAVIERLQDARRGRLRLRPIPLSGGRFTGEASLADLGLDPALDGASEYRVWIESPALGDAAGRTDRAECRFVVVPEVDPESRDLGVNAALLDEIAAATGGRSMPLAQLDGAAESFSPAARRLERSVETAPIDSPAAAALLVLGLLVLEWTLRKRRDLV